MAAAASTGLLRSVARRAPRTHRLLLARRLHGTPTGAGPGRSSPTPTGPPPTMKQDLGAADRTIPSVLERAKAKFKRNSIYSAYLLFGGFLTYALVKPTLDKAKDNLEAVSRQRMKMKDDIIQHIVQEFESLTVELEEIISGKIPEAESHETSGHGMELDGHQVE